MSIKQMGEEEILTRPIYVLGHRNPDTDSIAAALGYAELKQQTGDDAVAAQAGKPNPETQFALETFEVEPPILIASLRPRVRDVVRYGLVAAAPEASFSQAARLMRENRLKAMPVRDEEGRLAGIVSIADVMELYIDAVGLGDRAVTADDIRAVLERPVAEVMRREVVHFTLDDPLHDVRQVMAQTKHRSYPVVDEAGRLVALLSPSDLTDVPQQKVILIDHNSPEEAVPGIEEAEVLEIIDHHRLAGLQTASPLFIRMEPVGSSSTIVTTMFLERGLKPNRGHAGMLLSAILSDTLLFKSPTCTLQDRAMAEVLWEIAGVDWKVYGLAMLRAGSSLRDKPVGELITLDYKVFRLDGRRVGVGQINTMDLQETLERRGEFLEEMERRREADGLDAVLLMVTDPIEEGSEVLYTSADPQLMDVAFGRAEAAGSVFVPGMVSRKKQMIPLLTRAVSAVAGAA